MAVGRSFPQRTIKEWNWKQVTAAPDWLLPVPVTNTHQFSTIWVPGFVYTRRRQLMILISLLFRTRLLGFKNTDADCICIINSTVLWQPLKHRHSTRRQRPLSPPTCFVLSSNVIRWIVQRHSRVVVMRPPVDAAEARFRILGRYFLSLGFYCKFQEKLYGSFFRTCEFSPAKFFSS